MNKPNDNAEKRKALAVVVSAAVDEQAGDCGVVLLDPGLVPALESFAAFATELQDAGMVEATSATQRAFLLEERLFPLEGPWASALEGGDRPIALIDLPDVLPAPIGDVADVSVTVSQTGDLAVEVLEGRSGVTYLSDPFDLDELPDAA